ncbi:MAG: hypothetical protein KH972_02505 [Peptostreptococcaceae bacterium]|nr:hypothetical protein [Peptostreptococcaceae bacterium]
MNTEVKVALITTGGTILVAAMSIVSAFLVRYLGAKTEQSKKEVINGTKEKCLEILNAIIVKSVVAVNQTMVDSLKKEGAFTEEKKTEAFNKALTNVNKVLNDSAKKILEEELGDLDTYIKTNIEAEVKAQKSEEKKKEKQ